MEGLIEINKKAKGIEELVKVSEETKEKVLKFLHSSF